MPWRCLPHNKKAISRAVRLEKYWLSDELSDRSDPTSGLRSQAIAGPRLGLEGGTIRGVGSPSLIGRRKVSENTPPPPWARTVLVHDRGLITVKCGHVQGIMRETSWASHVEIIHGLSWDKMRKLSVAM